jgi:hypothetical protein
LAQSRHDGLRRTRPLSGVKQTWHFAEVRFRGRYPEQKEDPRKPTEPTGAQKLVPPEVPVSGRAMMLFETLFATAAQNSRRNGWARRPFAGAQFEQIIVLLRQIRTPRRTQALGLGEILVRRHQETSSGDRVTLGIGVEAWLLDHVASMSHGVPDTQ